MYDVLKFCYLSLCFLMISCSGNDAKKADDQKKVESVKVEVQAQSTEKTILFFGNSLTAGMGLDVEEAFPALIQKKIDSASLSFNVINAGLSGETTASGKNRLAWLLKQKVDVFVLELGANDGLRGIPLEETKKNLQNIIDEVKGHNSEVVIVLAGMQIPPNMGLEYTRDFRNIFPDLATENKLALMFVLELGANDGLRGIPLEETKKNLQNIIDEVKGHNSEVIIVLAGMQIPPNMGLEYTKGFRNIFPDLAAENKLALIPFLLMDVAGNPDLNQADGIHPTAEGQIIVANNVWEILKTAL